MLLRLPNLFLAVALTGITGTVTVPLWAQSAEAPKTDRQWKDRAEYDLYTAASGGKDPAANIGKLDEWTKGYPETQFSTERRALYLQNYVAQGKIQEAVAKAKEILAVDPNDFRSLYYTTLYTPALVNTPPVPADVLDQGDKAANGVLANLDKQKPATMADAQWETNKKPIAATAHTTLGWDAMQRKEYDKAETEFKQSLSLNPANGDVDYWLGSVEALQKNVAKMPEMLFYIARAASYDGQGAASAGIKQAASQYLDKAYIGYHGSKEGEDQLKQTAKANGAPPADYKLVSVVDIEKDKVAKENQEAASNPQLALWKNIKNELTGANGADYFGKSMKDALLPTLKGKVVKLEPETNPKTVVLSMIDGTTGDATLKFDAALPGKVEPGTELTFEGVPESYTADPFMVNFKVEKDKLHGWTGKGAAPARRAPVRRPVRK